MAQRNDDVQFDAQKDDDDENDVAQIPARSEPASGARPKIKLPNIHPQPVNSGSSIYSGSLEDIQSARPLTESDDCEYLKYISFMTERLQVDNIDILIINAESDLNAAADFQNHLRKDISFKIIEQARNPRVKLLKEIWSCESMDNLDLAFSKSLYVFLYVTHEFCADLWSVLQGQACLVEAISKKKWSVVPVHTCPKKKQNYKLPMMLNSLRAINYWSGDQDQFYIEGVRKLLELQMGLLLERDYTLDKERRKYFSEHRSEILREANYACSGNQRITNMLFPETGSFPKLVNAAGSQETTDQPLSDSSSAYGELCNDTSHSSLPDQHNDKALPEENHSAINQRMEEITFSEQQTNEFNVRFRSTETSTTGRTVSESQSHSSNPRNCVVDQIGLDTDSTVPCYNPSSVGQVAPHVPNLTARQPESSICTDGPAHEQPLPPPRPQNAEHRPSANSIFVPAYNGIVSSTYVDTSQYMQPGIAAALRPVPTAIQNAIRYEIYNNNNNNNNMLRQPMLPECHYSVMQPQFLYSPFYPHHVASLNPYLSMQGQHYPLHVPHSIQDVYRYANPNPQLFSFHNMERQPHSAAQQTSYIDSCQMSTQVNASDSLRSTLSYTSSTSAFDALDTGGLHTNQFHIMNPCTVRPQQFPLTSLSLARQQLETGLGSSLLQEQQTRILPPVEQENLNARQFDTRNAKSASRIQSSGTGNTESAAGVQSSGTGNTERAAGVQSSAQSLEVLSGGSGSAASSMVQHIHHHHHSKTINVTRATNVLIGDKSKFMNMDVPDEVDGDSSSDSSVKDENERPVNESGIPNSTRSEELSSRASRNNAVTDDNIQGPEALRQPINLTSEASMGFAENMNQASLRQPTEVSDSQDFSELDLDNQTCVKTV